ncbi:MAG: AAA family ATPase [Prevotellaceae bacterium]|nr:AAA family ATPase [Prevotellaceae bacterium]
MNLEQQRALLRKEYEFERAAFREELDAAGIDRRRRRGDVWADIRFGRSYYNSLDRLVVEIHKENDDEIEHNFEYGRSVAFFGRREDGSLRFEDFSCCISYAEELRMVVTLSGEQQLSRLLALERPGVALSFDETSYRTMFEALGKVITARNDRLASLRDLFHGPGRPQFSTHIGATLRLPWLNASQEAAVVDILRTKDVLIVHGPPGTGKTTTLIEAVDEVLRRETQVLVCAQSNMAVDWFCKGLSDRGIPVLRIGNPSRVTDYMLACTYERRFADHPDYPALWSVRRDLRTLRAQPRKSRSEKLHQKIARLRERADELELRIRTSLFDQCRVVACTLTGAASPLLAGQRFHTLFIDEAAQALEAACWIALRRADRVVFAGDHCQLPPTVKSPEALRGGLGRTLMEHLAETKPECVRLLTVQYRMNEELMRFSSDWFYGGQLVAAESVRRRSLVQDMDYPLVWVETGGLDEGETFVGNGFGRLNKAEAQLTLEALKAYIRRIGSQRLLDERCDIGVISPYRAQVQYLRQLIGRDDELRPFRRHLSVNTVDAFQGQERDIVLVSMVRANAEGQIGFLRDLRRMNVAMTRARAKLIILGDSSTLTRHKFYHELYRRCHKESCPLPPSYANTAPNTQPTQ